LLHFLADSKWNDEAVCLDSARYGLASMTAREPVEAWILDDTGFLKQGKHSVGVQRQYTGSAGKVTNCQIGVSLTVATRTEQLPIDFELYLPDNWANDPARRKEGRIPDDVAFKTKPELGLQMVERALKAGLPKGVLLADAGYGSSYEFRRALRQLALEYAVGVNSTSKVRLLGKDEIHHGKSQSFEVAGREAREGRRLPPLYLEPRHKRAAHRPIRPTPSPGEVGRALPRCVAIPTEAQA
jgi:SRSO17 transposase